MLSTIFEVLATSLGLAQGVLILLNKRINWFFYLAQIVCLIVFSAINNLWGDVTINALFIIYGVIGYITWGRPESKITKSFTKNEIIVSLLIVFAVVPVYFMLSRTNDPLPVMDSITTVGAFLATYLMVKRKLAAWIVWFVVDILYVVQYFILPEQAFYLMTLNVIWTGMAIASYISWRRIMNKQTHKIFVGAKYNVMHKDINPDNAEEMLKDDLRAKLVGVKNFIYPSQASIHSQYPNYVYNGGFYYENGDGSQTSIVDNELREIDESDFIFFDFTKPGIVATISELYYALDKNKDITIFKNPKLTTNEITSEYWFLFEAISKHRNAKNVVFLDAEDDDQIVKYIKATIWIDANDN